MHKNSKKQLLNLGIIGAGSFGTAIAIHLSTKYRVFLWDRNAENVQSMLRTRKNSRYLENTVLPDNIKPTNDLQECIDQSELLIIAVPSHAFAEILKKINTVKEIAWLTKGLDPKTHMFFSDLIKNQYGENTSYAIISGPSFAKEIVTKKPTAIVIAGNNLQYLQKIQQILHFDSIRAYISDDPIGVQLCGAVKNVLAIATGISDALEYGANTRAALITRGLAELCRLGKALGAKDETFMGLAGVGDVVLTCTDDLSRNRRFGLLLGKGLSATKAQEEIGQVVEGIWNVEQIANLATNHKIDMPICALMLQVLKNKISPADAALKLMQRPAKKHL